MRDPLRLLESDSLAVCDGGLGLVRAVIKGGCVVEVCWAFASRCLFSKVSFCHFVVCRLCCGQGRICNTASVPQ